MSNDFEDKLKKYAEVIIRSGLNLQPGQRLLIGPPLYGIMGVPLEAAPLIRHISAAAYEAGARFVDVMWSDVYLDLIRYQKGGLEDLIELPAWRFENAVKGAEEGDAILVIIAEAPNLFLNEDPEILARYSKSFQKVEKTFVDLRYRLATNITLIAAPVPGWSEMVFPDLPSHQAMAQFWEKVFEICRINQPDPVKAWKDHFTDLAGRLTHLNEKRFAGLQFTGPGTDLKLGLPEGHIWNSALMASQKGISFSANIPTEEVFTLPHKDQTEGTVTIAKPIVRGGGIIESAVLSFSGGEVVKAEAKKGLERLEKILEMDPGHRRLGEVALVPHSSPISQSGLTFYTTLIDENASSHIALGNAIKECLKGGTTISEEEFSAAGGNLSLGHYDVMIGSGEMDVDGLLVDGSSEALMRSGEWAFEV